MLELLCFKPPFQKEMPCSLGLPSFSPSSLLHTIAHSHSEIISVGKYTIARYYT